MKKLFSIFLALALIIFQINTDKAFADTQSGDFTYTVYNGTSATITRCTGSEGNIVIPDKIDGYAVTRIADYAFYDCYSLTNITIPSSVSSIDNEAFYGCSKLSQINVNANNINYGSLDGVLYNKDKTTLIKYPARKTDSNFTIPSSVTSISDKTFYGCSSLTSITIPISVSSIGNYAFGYCSRLTSITIPSSVTSIGDEAFYGCTKLSQINVNDNNTNYSSLDGVLYNKDKTSLIKYPVGKADSNFTIPNSVTSIDNAAFYGCSSLTSITISSSVTSIVMDHFMVVLV